MKSYSIIKVAPAFLLAGAMMQAQQKDSTNRVKDIEQVVLVGYGSKKKSDLTGSVTAISAKNFNGGVVSSPEQLIQGKAAGVQITTNGGAPGSGSVIRIRGAASLNASNDPLIVIDGMPLDNGGINGAANPLALINPNDIESFNILKDASATAIYGNRASNGVIIITTKKGTKGRLKVGYNATTSVSEKFGTVNVLDAKEYRQLFTEKFPNDTHLLGQSNTNWQEAIYQLAPGFDNNLSLSGGLGKVPFRLSLGYLNQDGILKTNHIERSTVGLNLNPKLFNNHLDINFNVKGTYVENRFANSEAIGDAVAFDPTQPIYNPNDTRFGGYWEWLDASNQPNTIAPQNPVSTLYQRKDISYVRRVLGNVQFDYKFHFLPELRANLNLGLDYADSNGSVTNLPTLAQNYTEKGNYKHYTQEKKNQLLEFYLSYAKKLPSIDSNFDIMAGYSYQKWNESSPFSPVINGLGIASPASGVDFYTQNILLSYYGRLNYTFKNRYLLTASIRRDGSSRFSENNRWGYFPSVSLAWRIDQEDFLKGDASISTLKLRGGWGKTGQQDLGTNNYPYLAVYNASNSGAMYQFGNSFYTLLRPNGYDGDIRWETTTTSNIGLDFGLLKDKILFTIDAYKRKTSDLLSVVPVPAGSNYTNLLLTNVGDMESKGLEVGATIKAFNRENFTWDITANATWQDAKITVLSVTQNPNQLVLTGGIQGITGGNVQVQSIGYAPNSFYVLEQKYDAAGNPLEGQYVDRNGDGNINEQDLYQYHSPMPKALFGLSSRMTYKNWDMGFALRASVGNYVYNNMNSQYGALAEMKNPNGFNTNLTKSYLDSKFEKNQYFSDYYVEDASFLRMDNINIGYNFPQFIGNARLRVNASVSNVFVITKYSGIDPEVFNGIDSNFYQRPRVYSVGFNVQF
ncbi:SusC/RagA family TonB-linked outer membrane protein [Riemerella columbina]|uniref:SusC/RagA family TonB-linked outer membrane protein n=1 Tax=Riemerella columbina TaxID=103810 RepID=UPI00266EDB99|nr:SusC/RagA family TonB-linked outer membrane protein [Riemerella columbina]WKS94564.1 SusC/RagA family TonB-linked outer membrane protein [Riemerella columbina]